MDVLLSGLLTGLLGFAGGWTLAKRQDRTIPRRRLYDELLPRFLSLNHPVDREMRLAEIERAVNLCSKKERSLLGKIKLKLRLAADAAKTKDRDRQKMTMSELDDATQELADLIGRKLR